MKKAAVLAILAVFILSPSAPASANGYGLVAALEIMTGYANGDFGGEDALTRAQFAKIAVGMADKTFTPIGSVSPYGDVPHTHWGAPYISRASDLELLSGYPDGTFMPDKNVTYEEAAKVFLRLLQYDASGSDWANAQIPAARRVGILDGVNAAVGQSVTRFDAAKMAQNTFLSKINGDSAYYIEKNLGYSYFEDAVIMTDKTTSGDKVLTSFGHFGKGAITAGDLLKCGDLIVDEYNNALAFLPKEQTARSYIVKAVLPTGIAVFENGETIEPEDDLKVFSQETQTVFKAIKQELEIGDKITLFDADGKTEYMGVEKDAITKPLTNVGDRFKTAFSITSDTKIFRDGSAASASEIQTYDICYYIQEAGTLLAYSKKQTGIYESASPSKDNPTFVTVSGAVYEISGINAFDRLSSSGTLNFGDTVTLLFDKDGKIADAIAPQPSDPLVGFLVDTGIKATTAKDGGSATRHYAKIALPDGSETEYVTEKNYESSRGKVVKITFSQNAARLTAQPFSSVSGVFDWAGKKLGGLDLSSDLVILDAAPQGSDRAGKYVKIFPQRIDAVKLASSDILYIKKNAQNKVSQLILNNVTNDMFLFGVVTGVSNKSAGTIMSGEYEFMLGLRSAAAYTASALYKVYPNQGALFDYEGDELKNISPLTRLSETVSSVDDYYLYAKGEKYLLSDKALIYRRLSPSSFSYEAVPLSEAKENAGAITAYYDKEESSGGRIRVLIL